uniref:Uncharacterized protein n=1 Tax=Fervidicoccus fontis TaxID=683846 RepID=A0A7J3ZJK4_9CREN
MRMSRDKLFMVAGFFLLASAFLISLFASYLMSPREKAVIHLHLPGNPVGEVILGEGVAERLYYNVSTRGDRHVQLSVLFFNERGEPVGGFYVEYSGVNSSGWLVLQESPYSVRARSNCTTCRSFVEVTLYYSRFNRSEVNAFSLAGTAVSILGMALLTGGLYSYVAHKYLREERPSKEAETSSSSTDLLAA